MLRLLIIVVVLLAAASAGAGTKDEVLAAYRAFAEAQNTREPARIRQWLDDTPDLLWVSDGKSFWGADAILARMTGFQKAEVWRVEPDLAAARVVELGDGVAMLHMPLTLVIGTAAQPDRLEFLVSLLFRKRDTAWRLAALLTTGARP
jgi:uncharacterized protein (TIGR02246 family)